MFLGITVFMLVVMGILMCSCSNSSQNSIVDTNKNQNSIVGKYTGSLGSRLTINEDGTCSYLDASASSSRDGKWKIEDSKIIISECYSLELYADISDFKGSFVLECTSWMWKNETFRKTS